MRRHALAIVAGATVASVTFFVSAAWLLLPVRDPLVLLAIGVGAAVGIPIAVVLEYLFMPDQSPFRPDPTRGRSE